MLQYEIRRGCSIVTCSRPCLVIVLCICWASSTVQLWMGELKCRSRIRHILLKLKRMSKYTSLWITVFLSPIGFALKSYLSLCMKLVCVKFKFYQILQIYCTRSYRYFFPFGFSLKLLSSSYCNCSCLVFSNIFHLILLTLSYLMIMNITLTNDIKVIVA